MKHFFKFLIISGIAILTFACSEDEDPCDNVTCKSNETCMDGTCICNPGADCSDTKSVEIYQIEILRFPEKDVNSNYWDTLSGNPDLYLTVYQSINPIYKLNSVIQNAVQDSVYTIEGISDAFMLNYTEQHTISLYDDDGNLVDDFIGGALFTPYNETTGEKPSSLVVDPGGLVAFKLYLRYKNL